MSDNVLFYLALCAVGFTLFTGLMYDMGSTGLLWASGVLACVFTLSALVGVSARLER